MNIDDIRLTPEEMTECYKKAFDNNECVDSVFANTATDKAIKYFMDLLMVPNSECDVHNSCECCGAFVGLDTDDANKLVALKKLVEG